MALSKLEAHSQRLSNAFNQRWDELESRRDATTRELNYCLKQAHWADARGGMDLRPSRIQPTGRELLQNVLHTSAQIARSEIYIDCRPVDNQGDIDKAEIAKQMLEQIVHAPSKLYHLVRDRVATFALAGRAWGAKVSFDPDLGAFGEIVFNDVDSRLMGWAKGYFTPHDPHCPWMYEVVPMTRQALEAMVDHDWDIEGLVPDMEEIAPHERYSSPAGSVDFSKNGAVAEDELWSDSVRIVLWWERNLKQRVKREVEYQRLHADLRYMQCGRTPQAGCGWRSEPQFELKRPLPKRDPGMCPTCSGDLHRVDGVAVEEDALAYPDGRLTVLAPSANKIVYEGPWPERTRTFPYLHFAIRHFPHEPGGSSVTSELWTRQSTMDAMDRMALEQQALAKPYWALPSGRVKDGDGRPWYFGDGQGIGMWYDGEAGQSGVEFKQSSGVPASWGAVRGTWSSAFERTQGTNDMAFDSERSRNIPVGTVRALERIRELPVDHLIDMLRWGESGLFGCTWDIARERYTDKRLWRLLGPDGAMRIQAMRASEQPDMDVVVTANPSLARIEREQAEGVAYIAGLPPHVRKFVARSLNVPVSVLRELERDEKMAQAQAMQTALAAGGTPQSGAGTPPAVPGPPRRMGGAGPGLPQGGVPSPIGAAQ